MSSGGRSHLGWAILTLAAPNKGPRTRASSVEVELRRCPRPAVAAREDGAEWVALFASLPDRPWRRGGWEAKRRLQLLRRETGAVLLALSSAFSLVRAGSSAEAVATAGVLAMSDTSPTYP
jgi:hypothetical protein